MNEVFKPRVGAVFSADIAVPEHEREVGFYSRVLSTGADPLWREDDLLNNRGMPIIGLGARSADLAGLPLQWMPHIQVDDVAVSVERALRGGGSVLMRAESQWAVLTDPGGAAFGIIPVAAAGEAPQSGGGPHPSPGESRVGRIVWLDLTVPDASPIRDFYRDVVGWAVQDVEMKDGDVPYADYNMLGQDGKPAAGICHARGVNRGLPPVWLIYLPVADLPESLGRVEAEGGTILKAVRGRDGGYVYAVIRDPVGVSFALTPG